MNKTIILKLLIQDHVDAGKHKNHSDSMQITFVADKTFVFISILHIHSPSCRLPIHSYSMGDCGSEHINRNCLKNRNITLRKQMHCGVSRQLFKLYLIYMYRKYYCAFNRFDPVLKIQSGTQTLLSFYGAAGKQAASIRSTMGRKQSRKQQALLNRNKEILALK